MKKLFLGIVALSLLWCNILIANEIINIPVNFHIVDFSKHKYFGFKELKKYLKDKNFQVITTKEHIKKDLETVNKIWDKAKIKWYLNEIDFIKPGIANLLDDMIWLNENCNKGYGSCFKNIEKSKRQHLAYRRALRIDKNAKSSGINVYYLPKMFSNSKCGIASTNPKSSRRSGNYVVIGHKCSKHDRGKTLAHELGHVLGLRHIKDKNNIMYLNITSGFELNDDQVGGSRNNTKELKFN